MFGPLTRVPDTGAAFLATVAADLADALGVPFPPYPGNPLFYSARWEEGYWLSLSAGVDGCQDDDEPFGSHFCTVNIEQVYEDIPDLLDKLYERIVATGKYQAISLENGSLVRSSHYRSAEDW
ncbi:hypothetical protein AB0M43_22570 [Longispora sp. NPDC051575]|uniref:hypothetical protein n=1 Tax=Longispora sp. NPDC051575 TaxID=3154943 RepID=UPI00341D67EE